MKRKTSMGFKNHNQQERVSHLFPENLGQCTTPVTSQAKQANKHHEKQGDVGNEYRNEIGCTALDVESSAGQLARDRRGAKLGVG